jgi:ATP-dependent DNA ligase
MVRSNRACDSVFKKLDTPYKAGPSKAWLKVKNPTASAALAP